MTKRVDFSGFFDKAHAAGMKAGSEVSVEPMIIGNGKSNYFVPEGVCGFAWVKIHPARGKFVSWLKNNGIGRTDSYYGGYTISVNEFGQSMTRKEAYARAFAGFLKESGIKAHANSRMD